MNNKVCVVCGFDKKVEEHHLIKRAIGGSDDEENLVYLCPNHHWIADFGDEKDRKIILEEIKKISGKVGKEISKEEKEQLDKKIRVLEEEYLCLGLFNRNFKPFTEEEWERHKETWNYENSRKQLLGRGLNPYQCSLLHKRVEILILIRKLKKELDDMRF